MAVEVDAEATATLHDAFEHYSRLYRGGVQRPPPGGARESTGSAGAGVTAAGTAAFSGVAGTRGSAPAPTAAQQATGGISNMQLLRFIRDSPDLMDERLTTQAVDLVWAKMRRTGRTTELSFEQFSQAVKSLAMIKYPGEDASTALHHMLQFHVEPLMRLHRKGIGRVELESLYRDGRRRSNASIHLGVLSADDETIAVYRGSSEIHAAEPSQLQSPAADKMVAAFRSTQNVRTTRTSSSMSTAISSAAENGHDSDGYTSREMRRRLVHRALDEARVIHSSPLVPMAIMPAAAPPPTAISNPAEPAALEHLSHWHDRQLLRAAWNRLFASHAKHVSQPTADDDARREVEEHAHLQSMEQSAVMFQRLLARRRLRSMFADWKSNSRIARLPRAAQAVATCYAHIQRNAKQRELAAAFFHWRSLVSVQLQLQAQHVRQTDSRHSWAVQHVERMFAAKRSQRTSACFVRWVQFVRLVSAQRQQATLKFGKLIRQREAAYVPPIRKAFDHWLMTSTLMGASLERSLTSFVAMQQMKAMCRAWFSWRQAYLRRVARQRKIELVQERINAADARLRTWRMSTVLASWRSFVYDRKQERAARHRSLSRLDGMLRLRLYRTTARAWMRWWRLCCDDRSQQLSLTTRQHYALSTLSRVQQAMLGRSAAAALFHWKASASMARQHMALQRRRNHVMQRLLMQSRVGQLHSSWQLWQHHVDVERQRRAALQKVVAVIAHGSLARSLRTWKAFVASRRRVHQAILLLQSYRQRARAARLSAAWHSWTTVMHFNVMQHQQRVAAARALRLHMMRLGRVQLSSAFQVWRCQARQRTAIARALIKFGTTRTASRTATLHHAMYQWRLFNLQCANRSLVETSAVRMVRRAVVRIRQRRIAAAFATWKHSTLAEQHRRSSSRVSMLRLCRRMANMRLQRAWNQWTVHAFRLQRLAHIFHHLDSTATWRLQSQAFHRWTHALQSSADHQAASRHGAKYLMLCLRRWRNAQLHRGWRALSSNVQRARRIGDSQLAAAGRLAICMRAYVHRREASAFRQWRTVISSQKSQQYALKLVAKTVDRACRRLRNRQLVHAWNQWSAAALAVRRNRHVQRQAASLLNRTARRWHLAQQAAAFSRWHSATVQTRQQKLALTVLNRWVTAKQQASKQHALRHWRSVVVSHSVANAHATRALRRAAIHIVSRWRHRSLSTALHTWSQHVAKVKQVRRLLQRWQLHELQRAWRQWRDFHASQQRFQQWTRSVASGCNLLIRVADQHAKLTAFGDWRQMLQRRRFLRKLVLRAQHASLYQAFARWQRGSALQRQLQDTVAIHRREHGAAMMVALKGWLSRRATKQMWRAWLQWRMAAATEAFRVHKSRVFDQIAAHSAQIKHRDTKAKVLQVWSAFVRRRHLARRVLVHLTSTQETRMLRFAFRQWGAHTGSLRLVAKHRTVALKRLVALQHWRRLAASFTQWKAHAVALSRHQKLMLQTLSRATAHVHFRREAAAFRRWVQFAQAHRQRSTVQRRQLLVLRNTLRTWQSRRLAAAFNLWCGQVVGLRHLGVKLSTSDSLLRQLRRQRALLSVIERVHYQQQFRAWNLWTSHAGFRAVMGPPKPQWRSTGRQQTKQQQLIGCSMLLGVLVVLSAVLALLLLDFTSMSSVMRPGCGYNI